MPRMGMGIAPSKVMIVGECYGDQDERSGEPFMGNSGAELNRMLHEAGIMRTECYLTNVVNARPLNNDLGNWIAAKKKDITSNHIQWNGKYVLPIVAQGAERLAREIEMVQPNVIIALGNLALFALTGAWGVLKWRGSQLNALPAYGKRKVIPTYNPSAVLYQWENRASMVLDLKRAAKERSTQEYQNVPNWKFIVRPSAETAYRVLQELRDKVERNEIEWIDFDLETRAGHIACAGISWSLEDAICIPLMCVEDRAGYFALEEEAAIVYELYRLLTHPKVKVRGQNLLYDAQYTYRHWHFVPRVAQDTMISHHTMFAGLRKSLDFQASVYCDHYVYWKDDGKTWTHDVGEDQLWAYNCMDCVRTREVGEVELASIKDLDMEDVEAFQQALFWPVLRAMQLGVRIDLATRTRLAMELQEALAEREQFFVDVLGHPLNPRSSSQMAKLFYNDFGIPPIYSRAKKGVPAHVTCDEEALLKIKQKEPLVAPIIDVILQYRQIGVFLSTFITMPLDQDNRMRCSYNICGTETYRFSSAKNAFGSGGNLQNLPKGDE